MDRDTIATLAALSNLRLEAAEEERARARIARLLAHFEKLEALDTEGVEASPNPLPIPSRTRPDEVGATLSVDEVLANAPARRRGAFSVPRVL